MYEIEDGIQLYEKALIIAETKNLESELYGETLKQRQSRKAAQRPFQIAMS